MSKEVDIVFYKHVYDDVKHLDGNDLVTHYNLHGTREYRVPNKDFFNEKFKSIYNHNEYIIKFPELADKSEEDAIHFFIYSDYVDPILYKILYQEIRHYDEMQCRAHYYCYGVDQKRSRNIRQFKENFTDYSYDFMKELFCENMDDYEFIKYITSDYINTIEYFFKEFYMLIGFDFYNLNLKEMFIKNLLFTNKYSNDNIKNISDVYKEITKENNKNNYIKDKENNIENKLLAFNYEEYKTNNVKLVFRLKVEYFIKYLIDNP